jgi:hypothetical protein
MTVRVVSKWDGHEFDINGVDSGCQYCGDPRKPPTTMVFGQPVADVITVVDAAGCRCCGDCVRSAIWLAMTEADWCRPAVRVIPIKAVA